MKERLVVPVLIAVVFGLGYWWQGKKESKEIPAVKVTETLTPAVKPKKEPCVPAFRDGGGPYYKLNAPFRSKLAPEDADGERLVVKGKVVRSDCETVVGNAVLDIWQADATGSYRDDWYRGQVKTDAEGNYEFETVVPKGYGEGTGYRPPHIHFKVWIDGREVITSQMFFPEVKGRAGFDEGYIVKLESSEEAGEKVHRAEHDVVLPM